MRISDWSSDVCSSDLGVGQFGFGGSAQRDMGDAAVVEFDQRFADLGVGRRGDLAAVPVRFVAVDHGLLAPVRTPGIERRIGGRSEERRVGKECVSTCRSRWWPYL